MNGYQEPKKLVLPWKRHHYRIILLTIQRKKRCIKYEYLYWTIPINDERNEIDILYKCCNYFCAICFLNFLGFIDAAESVSFILFGPFFIVFLIYPFIN